MKSRINYLIVDIVVFKIVAMLPNWWIRNVTFMGWKETITTPSYTHEATQKSEFLTLLWHLKHQLLIKVLTIFQSNCTWNLRAANLKYRSFNVLFINVMELISEKVGCINDIVESINVNRFIFRTKERTSWRVVLFSQSQTIYIV